MPFYDTHAFKGTLSGHGTEVAVEFTASIDDDGVLRLKLEPINANSDGFGLLDRGRPGEPVDLLTLFAENDDGHTFRSDAFYIDSWSHGDKFDIQGSCYDAELTIAARKGRRAGDARVWLVRQFRTFRHLAHETPLGRVVVGGPRQDPDSQAPDGFLAIYRPEG